MPKWLNPEFLNLQRAWYQKLADSGFQDCEVIIGEEHRLAQRSSNAYKQADSITRESKLGYQNRIGGHLDDPFDCDIEKTIMSKISEGFTITEISKGLRRYRGTIRFIIRKYEARWGITRWNTRTGKPMRMKPKKWVPTR